MSSGHILPNESAVIDAHGTTFEPWSDGWAVGYRLTSRDGAVSYLYLNPSSESDDGTSNVFLYHGAAGDPRADGPVCYVDVGKP